MPAPLVIILAVAATLAILVGVVLHIASTPRSVDFLPTRLQANTQVTIDADRMAGFWAYQDKNIDMTLQLRNGGFEWLIAAPQNPYARYYTRGSYRVDGDVLILQQREDFGAPIDLQRLDVKYLPTTLKNINLRVVLDNSKMQWFAEGDEVRLLPLQLRDLPQFAHPFTWSKLSDLTPSIR